MLKSIGIDLPTTIDSKKDQKEILLKLACLRMQTMPRELIMVALVLR